MYPLAAAIMALLTTIVAVAKKKLHETTNKLVAFKCAALKWKMRAHTHAPLSIYATTMHILQQMMRNLDS